MNIGGRVVFPSINTGYKQALFSESILSEIKSRIDLIDLISEYLPLKKAGRNFKGLCPFHSEKTPSFVVSQDKQIFHCFGCHEGGDIFGFVSKMDHLSFPEAVEKLADKAGIALEDLAHPKTHSKDEKEILFRVNEIATAYYQEVLQSASAGEKGRQYLLSRGLTLDESQKFRLGFAPAQGSELIKRLRADNIPLEKAVLAGVLREGEYGPYESFRGRLIFPILNPNKRVVGMGGRTLDSQTQAAKYINSSDSPIYDKSAILFGLPWAKEAFRKNKRAFVVEGYLDLIALHQFGYEEAVAPLGTALTPKQIGLLKRYVDEIVVLFDADEAGMKAAERALDLFLDQETTPKVLLLPAGEDPDSFLRKHGKVAFEEKLKETRNLFSLVIDKVLARNSSDIAGKTRALEQLRPYFEKLIHPVERNLHLRKMSEFLNIPESWLIEQLGKKKPAALMTAQGQPSREKISAEDLLLEIFLRYPKTRDVILKRISCEQFAGSPVQKMVDFFWGLDGVRGMTLSEIHRKAEEAGLAGAVTRLELNENPLEEDSLSSCIEGCIKKIRTRFLKHQLKALSLQIKEAEARNDLERVPQLIEQKQQILDSMNH